MIKNQIVKTIFEKVLDSLKTLKENAWQEMFDVEISKILFESLPQAIKILEDESEAKPENALDKMISDIDVVSAEVLKSNNIETLRNYAIALKKELDKTNKNKDLNDMFDASKDNYDEEHHEKLKEIYKSYCKTKKLSIDDTIWLMKNKKGNAELVIGKSILGLDAETNKQRLVKLGGIKIKRS